MICEDIYRVHSIQWATDVQGYFPKGVARPEVTRFNPTEFVSILYQLKFVKTIHISLKTKKCQDFLKRYYFYNYVAFLASKILSLMSRQNQSFWILGRSMKWFWVSSSQQCTPDVSLMRTRPNYQIALCREKQRNSQTVCGLNKNSKHSYSFHVVLEEGKIPKSPKSPHGIRPLLDFNAHIDSYFVWTAKDYNKSLPRFK